MSRQFWIDNAYLAARPLVMASKALPPELVVHLLGDKSQSAVKNKNGHLITPMQGACSSLVVPLVFPCWISGLPIYRNGQHAIDPLGPTDKPIVILSALVQPDFEFDNVIFSVVRSEDNELVGKVSSRWNDRSIKSNLVYHCTKDRVLPKKAGALKELENGSQCFILRGEDILCLELLSNIIISQLRLEQQGIHFLAQNSDLKGLLYTWNPAVIFARFIDPDILDDFLLKAITTRGVLCPEISTIAFNDFRNRSMVFRLQKALPHIRIIRKSDLTASHGGLYRVLHSNDDAFGKHILTQPIASSLDGAIGANSSAAASLYLQSTCIQWI